MELDIDKVRARGDRLAAKLAKVVHSEHDPGILGSALAEIAAIYFGGFKPDIRDVVISGWLALVRSIIHDRYNDAWPDGKLH